MHKLMVKEFQIFGKQTSIIKELIGRLILNHCTFFVVFFPVKLSSSSYLSVMTTCSVFVILQYSTVLCKYSVPTVYTDPL